MTLSPVEYPLKVIELGRACGNLGRGTEGKPGYFPNIFREEVHLFRGDFGAGFRGASGENSPPKESPGREKSGRRRGGCWGKKGYKRGPA